MTIKERDREQTVNYFRARGWQVEQQKRDSLAGWFVMEGHPVRCADDRHEDDHLGPAWFGATDGVAALEKGDIGERFALAVAKIRQAGFLPGVHGDHDHGDIDGCKFRWAWIEQKLHGLPDFSRMEARIIRRMLNMSYVDLKGKHTAEGLMVNHEPGVTVSPQGRFLVNDLWFPRELGHNMEDILDLSAHAAELILPENHRRLWVY